MWLKTRGVKESGVIVGKFLELNLSVNDNKNYERYFYIILASNEWLKI